MGRTIRDQLLAEHRRPRLQSLGMRRFSDYDPFAWLYHHYWAAEFHRAVVPALDRILLAQLAARAEVLDLCCGDGRLLATLARRGFRMTGLDGSDEMLSYARALCPKAALLLADARRFRLPPRFDAVVSLFDSLNHVMSAAELAAVFGNVWRCLKPGGAFVFDLNTEEVYRDLWTRTASTIDDGVVSVARGSYSARRGVAVCEITLLRDQGGAWSRSDFTLRQKHYPKNTVLRKLKAAGFEPCCRPAEELGMRGELGRGRNFFIARKCARH